MRVTDLKNILSDFYDGTTIGKAILIDGKWGCGKTYQIKEFIKNKEKIARACVRFCNFFTKLSSASSLVGMAFPRMT